MKLFFLPSFQRSRLSLVGAIALTPIVAIAIATTSPATGQTPAPNQSPAPGGAGNNNRSLYINAARQEADSKTGVFTAIGNVQIFYPARNIQATAAQAQYFSRERKIILSGNVYVLQQGNSIRGDSITYLIDEGRFIATPKNNTQVESIYIVNDTNPQAANSQSPNSPPQPPVVPQTPQFNPKPASRAPATPVIPKR